MPVFAVIIPTYNRLSTLGQTIESVRRQTFSDYECWIYDDCSTDGTWEVLQKASLDSRFILRRSPQNRRQHYCRNRVIEETKAEWITFVDSDDVWRPNRLELFHRAMQRAPEIGFWFSNGYMVRDGHVLDRFFEPVRQIPQGTVPGYYAVGNKFLPYVTTNVAIRRDAFMQVGLFREDMRVLEDAELYARMFAKGLKVGSISEALSYYRLHGGQITQDHRLLFHESVLALEASGCDPATFKRVRLDLLRDAATFLIKGLQPGQARDLLQQEGAVVALRRLWLLTFVPRFLLLFARKMSRQLGFSKVVGRLGAGERDEAERFLASVLSALHA
jgi:glycosyltransferase involved in cell wall biosynthesis